MSKRLRLLVIAGEASGDMHAAGLVEAIRKRVPDINVFGIGGQALRAAGMEIIHGVHEMAALGFAELLPKLFFFRRVFYEMLALARERRPDAIILVDYPGFNLRFAARAHAMGLKVIYYICPQVWAWRRSRIPKMAQSIDRLLAIFPFEPRLFENTGLKVDYVGHPLVDKATDSLREPEACLPWHGKPHIAVLPGSRPQEINRMLPLFRQTAELLTQKYPNASCIVASPSEEIGAIVRGQLALEETRTGCSTRWSVVCGQTKQVLRQAQAGLVASGTATLEAALMDCPMVIAYRVAPFNYFLLKKLVRLNYIGMVNIIANRAVCPELVQNTATPQALARAIEPLIADTEQRSRMLADFREVAAILGPGGAHERAAVIILEEMTKPH